MTLGTTEHSCKTERVSRVEKQLLDTVGRAFHDFLGPIWIDILPCLNDAQQDKASWFVGSFTLSTLEETGWFAKAGTRPVEMLEG